jgi:hypothetical protein
VAVGQDGKPFIIDSFRKVFWPTDTCPSDPPKKCADENGLCQCNGTVTYGAPQKNPTAIKKLKSEGEIICDNETFGDPLVGTVKACYCSAENRKPIVKPNPINNGRGGDGPNGKGGNSTRPDTNDNEDSNAFSFFDILDDNRNGRLSPYEIYTMFAEADTNRDQFMQPAELLAWMMKKEKTISRPFERMVDTLI